MLGFQRSRRQTAHVSSRINVIQRAAIEALESRTLLSASWQNVQIGGGGYVTGLASSATGSAIYARTDVGGAYRWDNAHSAWYPITESLPNDSNNNGYTFGIASLAVDPNNADRVFIASGMYTYADLAGIYVTTNANAAEPTWTNIDPTVKVFAQNSAVRAGGERLVVDPNNSGVVYYGTNNVSGGGSGLRKYTLSGSTWTTQTITPPAVGDPQYGITFVAVDKNGGTVSVGGQTVSKYIYIGVYSTTTGQGGVYVSSNGGTSWTKITGVAVDKPFRGEVGADGTLYVTHDGSFNNSGGVAKVARGSTVFTSIPPKANIAYQGLAVDPSVAGTVMVSGKDGSNYRIWRSVDGGSNWVLVNRNMNLTEPDGTPSVTATTNPDHISDLLINPANLDEVWLGDFYGPQRTQDIKDDTSASTWYTVQRGLEETVVTSLQSAPSGAPLLSGVADVSGFVHDNPDVRPTYQDRFEFPTVLTTTGLDFSEATSGANTAFARVGEFNAGISPDDWNRSGGVSLDGGRTWAVFGQIVAKDIANSSTAGWETFDVTPYLKQQKALGNNLVTLVVRSKNSVTSSSVLKFSSKEGGNAPEVVINGSTAITTIADAGVHAGNPTLNAGNSTTLLTQDYFNNNPNYWRWAYIKFDLSGVSTINSAVLRLYRLAASDTVVSRAAVYASADTSWIEGNGGTDNNPSGELTWNNRPALHTPPVNTGGRIAMSATDPGNLVWIDAAGTVRYSKDRGVTWLIATRGGSNFVVDSLAEFDVAKIGLTSDRVAGNTFYAYAKTGSGTLYRSTDGGATWTTLISGVNGGGGQHFKLEAVPGHSGKLYLVTQSFNAPYAFKYWNGSTMVTVPGISQVVDFTFGKAAPGRTNPTLFVRRANGTYWYSVDATAGSAATWTQINVPTLNKAPAVMEGDRQVFGRLYVGSGGRGIYYVDVVTGPVQVDDADPAITYSGSWTTVTSHPNRINGTGHYSDQVGAYIEYTFTGKGIMMIGTRHTNRGKADIYIDGVLDKTIDMYSATTQYKHITYIKQGLADGAHTIRVVIRSDKNPASAGHYIDLDQFVANPTIVDDFSPSITYTGTWSTTTYDPNRYEGTGHNSPNAGASAEITFTGTSFAWIGGIGPNRGKTDIYVDGTLHSTVDAYASGYIFKRMLWGISGLTMGTHTIKLVVRSDKNPLSTNYHTDIDQFILG